MLIGCKAILLLGVVKREGPLCQEDRYMVWSQNGINSYISNTRPVRLSGISVMIVFLLVFITPGKGRVMSGLMGF